MADSPKSSTPVPDPDAVGAAGAIDSKRSLFGRSIAVLAARAAGGGAAFALNVLLARMLGVQGVGVYFLATTVAGFGIILGRAGQENVVLRFGAIASHARDWSRLRGLRRESHRLVILASTVVGVLLFIGAPLLAEGAFHDPDLTSLLRILAVGIPLSAVATIDIELVRATEHVRIAAVLETLATPGLSLLIVVPLAAALGVSGAVLGTVITAAAVLLTVRSVARRLIPGLVGIVGKFDRAVLIRSGLPLLWVGLSAMLLRMTDTVMLGILADARAVGLYGAAVQVAGLATMVLAAVTGVVSPRFAALYHAGRLDELEALTRRATGWAVLLALPILVLCVAAPSAVLSIFGPEFIAGGAVVTILAAGHGVNVATGPVGALLMMSGHEKTLRNNVLWAGTVNIVLNVLLVPTMAATGAAIATAVSLAVLNLLSLVQSRRHIGIGWFGIRREARSE